MVDKIGVHLRGKKIKLSDIEMVMAELMKSSFPVSSKLVLEFTSTSHETRSHLQMDDSLCNLKG